jgi:hypothetical protein
VADKKDTLSLLEKAKSFKVSIRHTANSDEELELAVAWLKGDVNYTQVNLALTNGKGKGGRNVSSFIASALRQAYAAGKIKSISG